MLRPGVQLHSDLAHELTKAIPEEKKVTINLISKDHCHTEVQTEVCLQVSYTELQEQNQ